MAASAAPWLSLFGVIGSELVCTELCLIAMHQVAGKQEGSGGWDP